MNLDDLALQLKDDLERYETLKNKGLRAYFELLNKQKRQKRIRQTIQDIEDNVEELDKIYKTKRQERNDRRANDYRKYGEN